MKTMALYSNLSFCILRIAVSFMMYISAQVSVYSQYLNTPSGFSGVTVPQPPSGLQDGLYQHKQQTDQQNRILLQQRGFSVTPTKEEIIAEQQRKSAPVFLTPQQIQVKREMESLLKESYNNYQYTSQQNYYQSAAYITDLPNYLKARDLIRDMLEGKRELSVKDAFYHMEAAYTQLHLNYQEYNQIIRANADFIRQWLAENQYPLDNPEALHYGIQKFMSDTLYITVNGKKQGHIPYYYDYIDATAKDDKRNYFVTKTLATGSGQCHTFPITYLILAEALGVEAYLAYTPKHSFIRFRNAKGTLVNYETTVDRFLPNSFYMESLPVMADAQKNQIYISNLDRKQVVATALFDLAASFVREHWLADRTFIQSCLDIGNPHFSNPLFVNGSHSYLTKRLLADKVDRLIREKGIRYLSEIERFPEVKQVYLQYYQYMESVSNLGIQELTESENLRMLEYYDDKSRLQIAKNVHAKTKKSLFIQP